MEYADLKNPVWRNLVLNKVAVKLNFLPAMILLSRLRISVNDNSPVEQIEIAKNEIFELYFKSREQPNAKKDISLLLNK